MMQDAQTGVELRTRYWLLKKYPSCFVGSEAIEWLQKRLKYVLSHARMHPCTHAPTFTHARTQIHTSMRTHHINASLFILQTETA